MNKTQNIQVRSSNRFTILMGGEPVGLLQDLRCQDDYSPEPASGVGDIHVKEYVPTMARHTLSTSQACMFVGSLRELGVSFENGDDALRGLVFDIAITDRSTKSGNTVTYTNTDANAANGQVLRTYKGCSFASGDVEIRKHAIIINSATLNALDVEAGSAGTI